MTEQMKLPFPDPQTSKPILLVDFDGVIHSYTSGWRGADVVFDPPVPGVYSFLHEALKFFDVQIYSSRSRQKGGIEAMKRYLINRVGLPELEEFSFPTEKPAAFLTIDDRAIQFNGIFPDPRDLLKFKPWNKT